MNNTKQRYTRLAVKQCCLDIEGLGCEPDEEGVVFDKWFEYELTNATTGEVIAKDSISDIGQGIENASEQIRSILVRQGFLNNPVLAHR